MGDMVQRAKNMLDGLSRFAATPWARRLVLALFVAQAIILVFAVRIGTPPDESNHIQFINYYAHYSLDPFLTHQQPTYHLGDKTREIDYLYHYVMSWLVRLLPFGAYTEYHIIRLFSVLVGLLSLLTLGRVLKLLGLSAGVITVALLALSNLPMVLLMSAAVNNDNLVWLGMFLGIWLLIRLWRKPTAIDLVWLAALCLFGGLVKRDLLPIGLVFAVFGLVILVRHWHPLLASLRPVRWPLILAIVLTLLGAGLFAERIGGNLMRYHAIMPRCAAVHSQDACSVFWVNIRSAQLATLPAEPTISPPVFVGRWVWSSAYNIVDIQTQGWRHEVRPARWLPPYLLTVLVLGIIYGLRYDWRRRDQRAARWRLYVLLIALYYTGVQLVVNYRSYLHNGVFGIALNGRYVIPSVMLLAGLAAWYWMRWLRRHPGSYRLLALFTVLAVIAGSGLIMMLRNPQLFHG